MNYKINFFILFLLLSFIVQAQQQTIKKTNTNSANQLKGLKIGDKVPDIPMEKIVKVDGTVTSANTADYNDRLLILDFMYTSCSSCIAGLPKKGHLQNQFGNKIKLMVVVGGEAYAPGMLKRENAGYIQKFLTNKNSFLSRHNVQIPWVVENKLLNQYFPHALVSHLVWIYKGQLVAVTEQDYVTAENIQAILDGKMINLPVKDDFRPPVDVKTPLVRQNLSRFTGNIPLHRYAAFYGCYQDGVETKHGTAKDSTNHTRRDYIVNLPAINIYTTRWFLATGNFRFPGPSHVILEVKDPLKYISQEDASEPSLVIRRRTSLCYEAMSPDTGQTDQQVAMATIKDLDHLLGLHGRYEKRKMKCLILVRTDSIDRLKSKVIGGENWGELKTPHIQLSNQSLSSNLVWKINQFYGNPPTFDETGYTGNVDMDFILSSWQDIPAVRKALQSYGLDLKEEERELEVFVLTEKKYK